MAKPAGLELLEVCQGHLHILLERYEWDPQTQLLCHHSVTQLWFVCQDLPWEFSRFCLEGSASLNSFSSFSGEEVALYCAKYLPEIIKDQKAYKEGKLQKALEDAFLAIDAKLTTEEVIKELSQMAGRPQDDEDEKEKVADEDDGKSDATEQTRLQLQDRDVEQEGQVSLGTRFSVPVSQLNFGQVELPSAP